MSSSFLIFDLETVPDYSVYSPPEVPAGQDRPIAPPYAQRPIVVGMLWLDANYTFKRLGVMGEGTQANEAAILEEFSSFVEKHRPCLVTYNGRGFDLPVLTFRSFHHGIRMPWYYNGRDHRYRYSEAGHLDLCDYMSDHGASRMVSLNATANLIGMPGKLDVEGSQVESLYRAGRLDIIQNYCLMDVVQTAFVLLRMRLLQGSFSQEGYRTAAKALYDNLSNDVRLHELWQNTKLEQLLLNTSSS